MATAGSAKRTQLVIVALPSENDYVRKISSEKEPHLTLAYLGDPRYDGSQLAHIEDYVSHASSLLHQFTLEVDRRGELGDKKADVLFFYKDYLAKTVKSFRENLLQDPLISAAFNATEQFEGWTPHLTLGYPETPAKKPPSDYDASVTFVNFDRIALWIGDYEGPTFDLKPYRYEPEVAMSQFKSPDSATLSHYGVKGMRWGVRKSETSGGSPTPSPRPRLSEDARRTVQLQDKIDTKGTGALSNQEMRQFLERMDLEQRYSRMVSEPPARNQMDIGHDHIKKALKYAKTFDEARKFLESDTGKMVKKGITTAATVGFGYVTGGAGPAAAAGLGSLLRR